MFGSDQGCSRGRENRADQGRRATCMPVRHGRARGRRHAKVCSVICEWPWSGPDISNLEDLFLFAGEELVDLGDAVVGELLELLLGAALLVGADPLAGLLELAQVVHHVAADVADGDAALLGDPPHDLHEVLAALLRQFRDRQPHDLAVVRRRQPHVRLHDRLLDALDRRLVVRRDREQACLARRDVGELLEWRRGPVVVDLNAVEQRRRRASRAHARELVTNRLDRLLHPVGAVLDQLFEQSLAHVVETTVPTRSPHTIRSMLRSSSMLNTWIGRLLSMQSDRAVESMTARRCSMASRCVSSGMKRASGLTRGSASKTPSTPFLAIRIASAWISRARRAAAVSVVKNGLPVPAAKMTMRPFSRWRIARRRM